MGAKKTQEFRANLARIVRRNSAGLRRGMQKRQGTVARGPGTIGVTRVTTADGVRIRRPGAVRAHICSTDALAHPGARRQLWRSCMSLLGHYANVTFRILCSSVPESFLP